MARVLVVEDDEALAESLKLALEDDYEVVVAHHGRDALDALAATPIDVVVLDLMMPVMDGETFLAHARQRGNAIPVIVASAGPDLRRRVREMGADDYVQKPFNLDILLDKLASAVRRGGGAPPAGGNEGRGPGEDKGGTVPPWGTPRSSAATTTPSSSTTARTSFATWSSSSSPPAPRRTNR